MKKQAKVYVDGKLVRVIPHETIRAILSQNKSLKEAPIPEDLKEDKVAETERITHSAKRITQLTQDEARSLANRP